MPTIPLYSEPSHPDAWHEVRSPGGYEWWHFDADDESADRHLVVTLHQGCYLHPRYMRRYRRYRRFPTRLAPPLPQQFPCVEFALYEGGDARCRFTAQYRPDHFYAMRDVPEVVVGPNRISSSGGRFELNVQGADRSANGRARGGGDAPIIRGQFAFTPRAEHAAYEQLLAPPRSATGGAAETTHDPAGRHRWLIASPLCDVQGTLHIGTDELAFTGPGYHDHAWGTRPPGELAHRWLRGRVLLSDRAYAFVLQRPLDRSDSMQAHLIESKAGETARIDIARAHCDWPEPSPLQVAPPIIVALDDAIHLHNPRILDADACRARLVYDALCHGRSGIALCEVVYPARVSRAGIGRLLEMSIDKPPAFGA